MREPNFGECARHPGQSLVNCSTCALERLQAERQPKITKEEIRERYKKLTSEPLSRENLIAFGSGANTRIMELQGIVREAQNEIDELEAHYEGVKYTLKFYPYKGPGAQ